YGRTVRYLKPKKYRAVGPHRLAYELFVGPIPKGMDVLHTCDNRVCVKPEHLFLGNAKSNSDDKIRKGRARWQACETNSRAKLTNVQVREIRNAIKMECGRRGTTKTLAEYYKVKPSVIRGIKHGRSWKGLLGT